MTWAGGKTGISTGAGSFGAAGALALVMGTGLMRLGGGSGERRRRTEGFITEFERILVPYWCWEGAWAVGTDSARAGVATAECMRRRSLRGDTVEV